MTENPFITVVIPTLNEEKYISNCLGSVFSQTYATRLTEIYVIDGGSSDKTIDIVKRYQENHKNLFLLNNKKKIQAAAFNLGAEKAKGEIIIRLDAHCFYDPDYIYYCVLNHSKSDYGNVGGRWIILPGADTLMGKTIASINVSPFGLGGAAYRVSNHKMLVESVPFGSFRKKIVLIVGKMNENLHRGEDNEYNARILKAGYKILFDPRIVAKYYSRSTLKLFLKQMYSNGFSIGVLMRNSFYSVYFHNTIPMCFVLFLVMGFILSFPFTVIRFIFFSIVFLYFLFDLVFGLKAAKKEIRIYPFWIYSVLAVHVLYGIGTIIGLSKGNYKNK